MRQRFDTAEQALVDVWRPIGLPLLPRVGTGSRLGRPCALTAAEFEQRNADVAISTMTERPVLIHVPVGTGATGREALRRFYRETFMSP